MSFSTIFQLYRGGQFITPNP